MSLTPCPSCRRHVSITERACPFCSCALEPGRASIDPVGRLSRAAVFVAGAVTLGGCWTTKKTDTPVDHATTQTVQLDAGTSPAADAQPTVVKHPIDSDEEDNMGHRRQNHPCTSPGPGQPPVCAPYGAPPARRRLV